MKKFTLLLLIVASACATANAQINVGSSTAPDSSAMLQISGNTKGFLPPRVSRTEMNAIVKPAKGLTVFNTTDSMMYIRRDTGWMPLMAAGDAGWSKNGNAGTTVANFLGTTDNRSLRFRTNNVKRMILDSIGNMAIGTDTFDATNPEKFLISAGNTTSVNGLVVKGATNNYFQMNIKNLSSAANATSDIVATADNGTETTNYVDLGINGSGYTGSAIQTGVANDGYLISSGNDFYMVNSSANKNMLFLTGGTGVANERMRILANGRVGMGVQDPTAPFVVRDTMEIRRIGSLSQLLFTNTAGSGDFRIGGDGGDIYWQGGGGRNLQMGSYWTTVLTGDRLGIGGSYPSFQTGTTGTGILVQGARDASVPLGVQGYSATQTANLTEWRNSSGTVLSTVTKDGNFGIGTSTPSTKLHVVGTNPLTLNGVQTGAGTDSLLTIVNGTVKKILASAITTSSSNAWGLIGNSGTTSASNFLGTTDLRSLAFRTNNTQRMFLDSSGNVSIGASPVFATSPEKLLVDAGTTQSFNVISGKGTINNYLQLNIQNKSTGNTASSDVVATADNGDENNYYVDMGINGSGNNSANFFGSANDAYLYTQGQNLLIGTATASKSVAFLTGGGSQGSERMRIDGSGNVGIGISAPTAKLHVVGTNPLTLMGVQAGANTDSILTIASGVVRKLPFSTVSGSSSSGTSWSLSGNSGTTSSNFLGTTDNNPILIKINNQPSGRLDAVNTYLGFNAGYNNGANANQNTGIGYHAAFSNTGGTNNTALGYNSLPNNANGSYNIGIGYNADVVNNSSYSILMGANSVANQSNSIAIGNAAQTNNTNALSIGNYAYTNGNYGISIGNGSASFKTQGVGDYSTAIGYNATANSSNTIAIGSGTNSGGTNAITIGNTAAASGANSVAIGYNASATVANTIVLGDKSNTDVSVAIGPESFTAGAREKLLVDAGTSPSFNIISAKGNYNNYMQLNVQNRNNGGNASSDLVATCNDGDENNNYVDLGINSSGNNSGQWGSAYDAYLYSQTSNLLIGTAGNARSVAFLTGGGSQSSNERMRIDGTGNVGIGISAPTAKLHVVGTNPLTLMGVQTGTSTSADSLLTITSGVVKKLPITTFAAPSTDWSVTGNSNAPSGTAFMGTSNNMSVKFRTNNTQLMMLDSLGNVAIGSSPTQTSGNIEKLLVDAGNTSSYNVISGKGNNSSYLQLNIQNRNNGAGASSDIVATSDNGDESNNYVDLGINSSGNTSGYFGAANDAYLYAQSQNLLIGTASSKNIQFLTAGGTTNNERMRITNTGNIGMGVTTPTAILHLKAGTSTASTAPLKMTAGANLSTPEAGAVEFDGTNYFVTSGTTRYTMAKTLTNTATLDFPSTSGGSITTLTVTVTGARDGDVVALGVPSNAGGSVGTYSAYVSGNDIVTVKFSNGTSNSIDPPSGTFRLSVLKY